MSRSGVVVSIVVTTTTTAAATTTTNHRSVSPNFLQGRNDHDFVFWTA